MTLGAEVEIPPLLLYVGALIGFVVTNMILTHIIGPRKKTPVKDMPYESGMDPIGDARQPFDSWSLTWNCSSSTPGPSALMSTVKAESRWSCEARSSA